MSLSYDVIHLKRDVEAIQVPSGVKITLPAQTSVIITQSLGGTFTIQNQTTGGLYTISGKDADALGQTLQKSESIKTFTPGQTVEEKSVWDQLRTCYDPEIPVNIVDLGLVYDVTVKNFPEGGSRVDVKMTLTAPGCGMGPAIASDAQYKLLNLPGVREANVEIVWDPPWHSSMISETGRQQLGIA